MTSRIRGLVVTLAMTIVAGVVMNSAFLARAEDAAKVSGDLKAIQGRWTTANDETSWKFDGDTLKATVSGQDYVCKVKLDPKASPHPTADFVVSEGPGEAAGMAAQGIYKLDGDTLSICVNRPGQSARPTEFKAVEDEAYLFELKRVK